MIRELKLFSVLDDDREGKLRVTAIHDDEGYRLIRQLLASQYDLSNMEPNIQVTNVDVGGDRSLTLRHRRAAGVRWRTTTKRWCAM